MEKASSVSRRTFVAGAAAASAMAALAAAGCSPTQNSVGVSTAKEHAEPADISTGTWVSAACWHNCGGRCLNKVLVNDGVVIRQKTDDTHEDSVEHFQQRGCNRGRAQRKQVFAADRIRKPLKRSGWAPGGGTNSNGEMRGKDSWEEIEWDEALTLIAQELDRIKTTNGNKAFFCTGGEIGTVLNAYGGYVSNWGTGSYGSWAYTAGTVGFFGFSPDNIANDRFDYKNCDTIIMLGLNAAWTSPGSPIYHGLVLKEQGVKFIGIDPFFNESYSALDAEWIPCYPGCDTALLIGIAAEMVRLDAEKQLIDWDFLNKYSIGFDAEHMPEGEDPAGNYKDYLLGTYDGIPKTPEWASVRCGVPAEKITYLAELMGKDNKTAFLASYCLGRNQQADNAPQALMALGAMGGHYGKSGHMCGMAPDFNAFGGGPDVYSSGSSGLESVPNPITDESICNIELWKSMLRGTYNYTGNSSSKRKPGVIKPVDIKMIWHSRGALLQTCDDQGNGIKAHRKMELVVSNASFMTTNSKYADFILPVSTLWERPGGFLIGNREMCVMYTQVIDRYYETYSDQEIAKMLAPKLGVDGEAIWPISATQQFYNQAAGATMIDGKGEEVPLISFTKEEIDALGVDGEPQDGYISFTEYKEKGVLSVKRADGDVYTHYAGKDWVDDPVENPMPSDSGLFEIYCSKLSTTIKEFGYSEDVTPIPTVYYGPEGLAGRYANGDIEAGVPSEYPFHLYNPHYLRRSHSVFDNVQWLREAWVNPVYVSASDAKAKGVKMGDTVKVTSPHGVCLRTACVTERLVPGVVGLPHGAWVDVDESTGIDMAGSDNYLMGSNCGGAGVSGWNSQICNFEKHSTELPPDVELPLLVNYDQDTFVSAGQRR